MTSEKKNYDKIVDNWNIEVATSVVADIHISLQSGEEYLKSTYKFNDSKLHGSFFAFDNEVNTIDDKLSKIMESNSPDRKLKVVSYKPSSEITWWNRAIVIYFKIHRQLGRNSISLTSDLYGMKHSTIATWLTNRNYISTWFKLVSELTFTEVVKGIPADSPYLHKYKYMTGKTHYKKIFHQSLLVFEKKISMVQSQ